MASPIAVLGFEQGTTAGMATGVNLAKYVDRTVGTLGTQVEIVAAAARTGTYGLRLTSSAATVHIGWQNSGASGLLGTASTLVGSFWFRFPTLPSNDYNIFIGIGTAGGNDFILKYLNSTTGLQATLGGSTQLGPNISANTWYQVDFSLVLNANPHTLDWKINGVAQTSVSLAAASESLFIAGFGQDNANSTGTLHVDDVVISTTTADYPLGGHKVVGLKPDTGGTTAEIGTANATARFVSNGITLDPTHSSANILAALSELPPVLGGSASGVYQRTSGATNAVGIPMTTYTLAGGETISGLRVLVCGWSATSVANNIGLRTFNGTSETTLFAAADPNFDNSTTVPGWLCKMATVADFDTQTELDALVVRYGYSTDISPVPGAHAIYAEVAVKEATGTSANAESPSGTGAAQDPTRTIATGSQASVGSGTANIPTPSVGASGGAAAATGTANNATISTAGGTNAAAATATATGTANAPTVTGTAAATPSTASATGAAQGATAKVSPVPSSATGTGTANNPTVQTGSFTNAQAATATATGTAQTPSSSVKSGVQAATGTGTASNPSPAVPAHPGTATGSGTANNPTVTRSANPQAGLASATGTVSAVSLRVLAAAEAAAGLAAALDVSVTGGEKHAQSVSTVTAGRGSTPAARGQQGSSSVGSTTASTSAVTDPNHGAALAAAAATSTSTVT